MEAVKELSTDAVVKSWHVCGILRALYDEFPPEGVTINSDKYAMMDAVMEESGDPVTQIWNEVMKYGLEGPPAPAPAVPHVPAVPPPLDYVLVPLLGNDTSKSTAAKLKTKLKAEALEKRKREVSWFHVTHGKRVREQMEGIDD